MNVPDDLKVVLTCNTCGNIFGIVSNRPCEVSPCDKLRCFSDKRYRFAFRTEDKCAFEGDLQVDCGGSCDTACVELCDIVDPKYTAKEDEIVVCAFDLTPIGSTSNSLCSGGVPDQFCDNAEADGRTCYVARISVKNHLSPDPALVFSDCAPVFRRINDGYDYWACPMTSPVSGNFVDIYETTYCDDYAEHYGETMEGYEELGVKNANAAGDSISEWMFHSEYVPPKMMFLLYAFMGAVGVEVVGHSCKSCMDRGYVLQKDHGRLIKG